MRTGPVIGLVVALVMVVVGAVWTFQGLGYLEGSSMTGEDTWAIIGPILAGLGVALGVRRRTEQSAAVRAARSVYANGSGVAPGSWLSSSRAWAATLCSTSTSYFVATTWVTEEKSRWPRVMA